MTRPFAEFPELMQLHVDSLASPYRFEFVALAAGAVVDASRDYAPVCLPFRAFPHWDDDLYSEEKFVPPLHMPEVAVYRKCNALSAFLFAHKGKWLVASHAGLNIYGALRCARAWTDIDKHRQTHKQTQTDTDTATATTRTERTCTHYSSESPAHGLCLRQNRPFPTGITEAVSDVFWRLWNAQRLRLPAHDGRQYFFAVSEFARTPVTLVGARLADGSEVSSLSQIAAEHGWPVAADERASVAVDNIVTLVEQLNAAEYEGYVLCDPQFRRVRCWLFVAFFFARLSVDSGGRPQVSYKSQLYRSITHAMLTPFAPSSDEREFRFFMLGACNNSLWCW